MRAAYALPLLGLLVVPGCGEGGGDEGGDGGDAAASRTQNACDLIKSRDVARAFGTPFRVGTLEEHGTEPGEAYFSVCVFEAADDMAIPTVSVSLRPSAEVSDPSAAMASHVDDMQDMMGLTYQTERISGLGGAAGWDPPLSQVTVFAPGLMLTVGAAGADEPRDAAVELARIALERAGG